MAPTSSLLFPLELFLRPLSPAGLLCLLLLTLLFRVLFREPLVLDVLFLLLLALDVLSPLLLLIQSSITPRVFSR